MNEPAAERILANAITHELRRPWRTHAFDYRGNTTLMTSPYRATAAGIRRPSVFIEQYAWGVTDPDPPLNVPALAWLLTQHEYYRALAAHPIADQAVWRAFLQANANPFRRSLNRHGSPKMRRNEGTDGTTATVALSVARSAKVLRIPAHVFREAFPVDLVTNVTGVPTYWAHNPTVYACAQRPHP